MDKIKVGDMVKHDDGRVGHVVAIRDDLLVEWKGPCNVWHTSSFRALTVIDPTTLRWRSAKVAA